MIGRRISGVWASANQAVALELSLDGRFEERHDGELVFEGHYELVGDDVRLFEDGGGQLTGRLTEGRLSLTPPPPAQRRRHPRYGQKYGRPSIHAPQPLY
ncbi:Atu4866 domain-containing protein [Caulobacter sp. UNC358MFTsu5.1]|uniref:Atu4866 domain-containing protein n=1 Tax=Caulobacter sp. UNC358MFTsu5.1 TaxID=1449049 RepID=UPI0004A6D948|nr:Atu4866 domain-containing protein [Caulobacter sp. UNC358MFTsu5.1]